MLTTDRVAGAALALVALLALADSRALPLGTVRNPGPAYVLVLLALGLLLLGVLISATGGRAPRGTCQQERDSGFSRGSRD